MPGKISTKLKQPGWAARFIPLLSWMSQYEKGWLHFDAGLFFASADALVDRLIDLHHQADPRLHTVVLDFEGINFIDSQGSETIAELIELAASRNIELRLTRVKTKVKGLLQRDGIIEKLGENRIYGNVYEAAADKIL